MKENKVYTNIGDALEGTGYDSWSVAGTWGEFTVYELLSLKAIHEERLLHDKVFGSGEVIELCIGSPGYILEKDGVFRFPNDDESHKLYLKFP